MSATPHAEKAYALGILADLTAEERAALDRFAQRALDNPHALPIDAAEAAALAAVHRAADRRGRLRLIRGGRNR